MVSESNIRIHSATNNSLCERMIIDTDDLRLSRLTARTQLSCVSVLRDRLMESFSDFGVTPAIGLAQICMALEESLANAFYHGNLELDSQLKEENDTLFAEMARERCAKSPWKDRVIEVDELATPFGIWITIRDQGSGFDTQAALRRVADPINITASGRGLVMMRAFTDELIFNTSGNEVTLVLYHKSNGDIRELLNQRESARHTALQQQQAR